MPHSIFQELRSALDSDGVPAALSRLQQQLRKEQKYHELYEARLMEGRFKLGLPVDSAADLEKIEEPRRSQVEEAYLDMHLEACREVGRLLLDEGRLGEAWMFLRPAGDKQPVAEALETVEPDEENLEELVQVAVHEGVAPRRGFEIVLEQYGICNAITMYDSAMHQQPREEQQQVAALLVGQLHSELLGNLKAEVARAEGSEPAESTIRELVEERDWLFAEEAYHIDTSHLHSVVRFARVIDEAPALQQALDLTEYGRRLSSQYQFQTEEPFSDGYDSHALFFAALLDRQVDEAVDFFRGKAESLDVEEHGSGPAEIYVSLLSRLGRHEQALKAAADTLPPGAPASGFAPSLLEMARAAENYDALLEVCQNRNDLLGFAAGLVERNARAAACR